MSIRCSVAFVLGLAVAPAAASRALGQAASPPGATDTLTRSGATSSRSSPSVPTDEDRLVSKRDAAMLAGAIIATGALAPLDHDVQKAFRGEDVRAVPALHSTARALAFTGGPGPFIVGGTFYVIGEVAGSRRSAALGVTLTEGVVLAAAINGFVKGVSGRALPNAKAAEPGEFSFGRGFHDGNGAFVSFPSGHTAASFAAATVVSEEVSDWNAPAARVVTPCAYSLATLVALSRLYQNLHWASDLPLGAAIGIWSGKTVVSWQHRHPENWLLRGLLNLNVAGSSRHLTITGRWPLAAEHE